jgi:uncharacterized protein YciI
MFFLNVSYIKPEEMVTPHREGHVAWVQKYFDEGTFLMSGPKKSKLGGVILAKSIDKNLLKKIIDEDPYVAADVAEYQIIDFTSRLAASDLIALQQN